MTKAISLVFFIIFLLGCQNNNPKEISSHSTRLILSGNSSNQIMEELPSNDLLNKSFEKMKKEADKALENQMEIPIPADPGGGYTHEKHKKNYSDMYAAAIAYSITQDTSYSDYVGKMLLAYAEMYPKLPLHPERKENHPAGKLFWQGLNESVWLFYTIQAYDLVKDTFPRTDRETIEKQLFRTVAKFLSEDSYETFNKVHNHGTWSVAAVGMTGYVLQDSVLVNKALHGSELDDKSGFYAQLNTLFSPDGYYSEGPYYQRYAMLPFVVFAEAIEENQPELKIFQYRNQLLRKAINTIFQLTTDTGYFYPYNDAIKDKDLRSQEMVFASNIGFCRYQDSSLLSIIKEQKLVTMTNAGLQSAIAFNSSPKGDFQRKPMLIKDGPEGKSGGVALLRKPSSKKGQFNALFKFASQGMGHGHFDRLSLMVYDQGREILQDYGAARFLNVEPKNGGRYLPENKSFAKQSVAHNTLIVDETSHYQAKVDDAEKHAPKLLYANLEGNEVQIVSAEDNHAYEGIALKRTIVMVSTDSMKNTPFLIDVFQVQSETEHQYDLNYQYLGQLMDTNYPLEIPNSLNTLGTNFGYQHLYRTASGELDEGIGRLTFLNDNKFYSISTLIDGNTQFILTEMGASDPNFNLRHDPGYLIRKKRANNALVVSVIEPHGNINPQLETVQSPNSNLILLDTEHADENYVAIVFQFKGKPKYRLIFNQHEDSREQKHNLTINGKTHSWTGNYKLETIK